jgi:hypothetical protein
VRLIRANKPAIGLRRPMTDCSNVQKNEALNVHISRQRAVVGDYIFLGIPEAAD